MSVLPKLIINLTTWSKKCCLSQIKQIDYKFHVENSQIDKSIQEHPENLLVSCGGERATPNIKTYYKVSIIKKL